MNIVIKLSAILIPLIIFFILGFIGDPFLLILFLNAVIFFFSIKFLLRSKKKTLRVIFGCFLFLFLGGSIINHYCFPDKFHPISLIGDLVILIFTCFLGWNLLKINKKRIFILLIGFSIFTVFILTLMSSTSKNEEQLKSAPDEVIKSLPYLSYVIKDKAIEKNGVTKYNPALCSQGLNIYNSFLLPGAYLLDMKGKILHTWLPEKMYSDWFTVKMVNNGDLLVSIRDKMLMRLDWNSEIKWKKEFRSHHDIAIAENDDIFTLSREDDLIFTYGIPVPVLNDYLIILSPDGKIKRKISFFKILKNHVPFNKIMTIVLEMINPINFFENIKQKISGHFIFNHDTGFDIFHNNTITIIEKNINGLCKKGDILISVRELDLIGIIDIHDEKLIWSWGPGDLDKQHHPTLLDNENILIFDNGIRKRYSRTIEVNPLINKIVWEYKTTPPYSFFTQYMGAVQKCPNGNMLITESEKGFVFEITKEGKIVWEFYNPDRVKNGNRAVIYRMMRIHDLDRHPLLKNLFKFG